MVERYGRICKGIVNTVIKLTALLNDTVELGALDTDKFY